MEWLVAIWNPVSKIFNSCQALGPLRLRCLAKSKSLTHRKLGTKFSARLGTSMPPPQMLRLTRGKYSVWKDVLLNAGMPTASLLPPFLLTKKASGNS